MDAALWVLEDVPVSALQEKGLHCIPTKEAHRHRKLETSMNLASTANESQKSMKKLFGSILMEKEMSLEDKVLKKITVTLVFI